MAQTDRPMSVATGDSPLPPDRGWDDGTQDITAIGIPDLDLCVAAEWTSVITDDITLGGLLTACDGDARVPEEVGDAVDDLLTTPLSRLSGHEVTPLGELIEALMSQAKDPELLVARECSRVQPTLAVLGREWGVSRERVRQKVADDALLLRGLLASNRYRAVRWAAKRLEAELGLAIPAGNNVVQPWSDRLGERRFQILRWIACYGYEDDWLVRGRSARSDLAQALDDAIGNEWLVQSEDLMDALAILARPEAVNVSLLGSGTWRDIGAGWLVRWDGPIHVKAERVLQLVGRPMTPAELMEAIGYGSERSLKSQRGNLVRIDKRFRLALPEWGFEEYEGIVTEIKQRIERGAGVASRSAMIDEFTTSFGLRVSSVTTYLNLPMFDVSGDSVRFADAPNFSPRSPSTVSGAVRTPEGWGERLVVTEHTIKGYSFQVNPHIAWANGIRPADSLMVPVNGSPSHAASVIWRTTNLAGNVDVGRVREWLAERGIGPGAELLVCPNPDSVRIYVGEEEIEAARRDFEATAPPIDPEIAAMMEQL